MHIHREWVVYKRTSNASDLLNRECSGPEFDERENTGSSLDSSRRHSRGADDGTASRLSNERWRDVRNGKSQLPFSVKGKTLSCCGVQKQCSYVCNNSVALCITPQLAARNTPDGVQWASVEKSAQCSTGVPCESIEYNRYSRNHISFQTCDIDFIAQVPRKVN